MATIDDLKIGPQQPGPRRPYGVRTVVTAGIVLALATIAWTAFRHFQSKAPEERPPVPIQPSQPQSGTFTAAGYIEVIPPGPIVVSSPIEGQVESISVVTGQMVKRGELLGRIQDAPYRQEVAVQDAAVALAQAHLARMQAGYRPEEIDQTRAERDRAQAKLDVARANLHRDEPIVETGGLSQKVLDASRAEVATAEAELAARAAELKIRERGYRDVEIAVARAELAAAKAELDRARWQLERCEILAPSPGVVLELYVQPGHWIYPRASGERPGAILSLADPQALQAWVDVNQRDLARVSVGQAVYLSTDARPDERIPGRVSRIMPTANLQKNTVQVKVEIPDPTADLRPEMSVKVTFVPMEKKP